MIRLFVLLAAAALAAWLLRWVDKARRAIRGMDAWEIALSDPATRRALDRGLVEVEEGLVAPRFPHVEGRHTQGCDWCGRVDELRRAGTL
jgi:hypothetical protein